MEQIHMLEKANELRGDGVLARLEEIGEVGEGSVAIEYTCMCGALFRREYTCDQWNALEHDKFTCARCGLKYLLDGETYNPLVIVKLEKEKKLP